MTLKWEKPACSCPTRSTSFPLNTCPRWGESLQTCSSIHFTLFRVAQCAALVLFQGFFPFSPLSALWWSYYYLWTHNITQRSVFNGLFVLCWKTYKLNTTYDEKDFLCKDPWSRHWSPNCFDKSVWVHGINPVLLWRTSVIKSFWRVYFLPVVSFLFSFLSLCLLQVVNTYSMTVMIREEEYALKMCDTSGKDKHFCSQFNN